MLELNNTIYLGKAKPSAGGESYVLPAATSSTLGGVKIGSGLSVTEDGTLSASDTVYTQNNLIGGTNVEIIPEPVIPSFDVNTLSCWHFNNDSREDVIHQYNFGNANYQGTLPTTGGCFDGYFSGKFAFTDYWSLASMALTNLPLTVDFRYKPSSSPSDFIFGACQNNVNASVYGIKILASGTAISTIGEMIATEFDLSEKSINLNDGNWHHIAFEFNTTTSKVLYYVDGKYIGQETVTSPTAAIYRLSFTSDSTNGIDELRVSTVNRYNGADFPVPAGPYPYAAPTGRYVVQTDATATSQLAAVTAFAPYIQSAGVRDMNEQQTVDAADLLAATGSFHALNLDLSKNTELKKVTAKGTSGSLANLSGVLVSQQAPLDSTISPQIDVSYSALNRAALVGLFNSLPYNCGYDVVGSPNISDGVASDFSAGNYLKTSLANDASITSFEMGLTFTTPSSSWADTTYVTVHYTTPTGGSNLVGGFILTSSGDLNVYLFRHSDNSADSYDTTGYDFRSHLSSTYTAIIKTDMSTVTLNVYDSTGASVYSHTYVNQDLSGNLTAPVYFGSWPNATEGYAGSIDISKTYINIDGKPWFRGTATATKTCNVAGATGTADLTVSDKDIAEDKGWSLTTVA